MSLQLLPDVNVWVALNHEIHLHHRAAHSWFGALDERSMLIFCRQTQIGFLRLLSTETLMKAEVLTQRECWQLYTKWIEGGRASCWNEPPGLERNFYSRTVTEQRSPKVWQDAYLAAFAETAGLTLVTFDKALAGKAKGAILLN
ncbi:TA system VapC family ribonuclease toxin [Occallatibacter riparius]|uniref:Ribonuclease VapC n=1 Tax=Occallatibacter riparius TaxID=1002689 RepID=A0A9J7BVB8_9BACT|nr:TA system VapC family ribonuclease toxin [Occallatibacter riparius]UWZ86568.1 hypothetical protein MOP44_11625 [Occallatibacter riparius]